MSNGSIFDVRFNSSSPWALTMVFLIGIAGITLTLLLSQSFANQLVEIILLISLTITVGLLSSRHKNARLSYAPPEVKIHPKSSFFTVSAKYALKEMEFGDRSVGFKVRRLGIPAAFNVKFPIETFEEFKKLVEEEKPLTLVVG